MEHIIQNQINKVNELKQQFIKNCNVENNQEETKKYLFNYLKESHKLDILEDINIGRI
jgi:hypothetical protein